MYVKLSDTIRATFGVASTADGSALDADSLPTCVVLDAGTPMGYAPVVVHQATGLYEVPVAVTAGNGFTVGHAYSLYVVVVVGGKTSRGPVHGVSSFTVTLKGPDDAGGVTVNAILDELLSAHSVIGSVGDGIAIAAALLQGNFYMDQTNNTDPNGQTASRLRCFRTGTATAAATDGGSGQGEFATFLVTTTYVGVGKIATHRVVRQ